MTEKVIAMSDSPEAVALKLASDIAHKEELFRNKDEYRAKLLDLYSECLDAVEGRRG